MPLTKAHLIDVCMQYRSSKECRYLEEDDENPGKFYCKKLSPIRNGIDIQVEKYAKQCKKDGIEPAKQWMPIGDNCSGLLPLRTLVQGYDV